jgi:hypothetical protein
MKLFLILVTITCLILTAHAEGPIVIKEDDSSAIIIGHDMNGGGGHDAPIIMDEKKSLKSMWKSMFRG